MYFPCGFMSDVAFVAQRVGSLQRGNTSDIVSKAEAVFASAGRRE